MNKDRNWGLGRPGANKTEASSDLPDFKTMTSEDLRAYYANQQTGPYITDQGHAVAGGIVDTKNTPTVQADADAAATAALKKKG